MELRAATRDRENFLRTMFLKDFLRSGHSFLQKVTDGRNKAWGQGPACKETIGEGNIGHNPFSFLFSLQ